MTNDAAATPGLGQCAITGKVLPEDELVMRALVYAGPGLLVGFVAFTGNRALISMTSTLVLAYLMTNVIFALIDSSRQRALHDRIAGTRVVRAG